MIKNNRIFESFYPIKIELVKFVLSIAMLNPCLLPSSVPVAVPVKFNWTDIALLSVSSHPPHPTRERYFQFPQEAEIWYAT